MRLLNVDTFKLEDFFYVDTPPRYAILSHTWGSDSEEVSYRDVLDGRLDSPATRPPKVTGCCKEAEADGYQYVWIDTCCIDKTNSVELQEAINSMFRWYRGAAICYAYLSDVTHSNDMSAFASSRWFRRGWTLQELLAPLDLRFYDAGWTCMGTKGDLCHDVENVTGIPALFLLGIAELHQASVAQRMSWAANRVTRRQEDIAYCLLGIFGVTMPMIYGEGEKAFRRLQEQIIKEVGDDSILAWDLDWEEPSSRNPANATPGTALAPAPSYFANSGQILAMDHPAHSSLEVHGGSLRLPLTVQVTPDDQVLGLLRCGHERHGTLTVAIPLVVAPGGQPHKYFRAKGRRAVLVPIASQEASDSLVHIQLDGGRRSASQVPGACWFHIRKPAPHLELVGVYPAACWHKERALIQASVDSNADAVQRFLVRFRDSRTSSDDFVVVLEIDPQSTPRTHLMVAFRETPLEEIAGHSGAWRNRVFGQEEASNGAMNLGITLDTLQTSPSQRRFILKPRILSHAPSVTVNATVELRVFGATALLQDFYHIDEVQKSEAQALLDRREITKQRLAQQQAELERLRAEIEALQKEERLLAEKHDLERKQDAGLLDQCGRAKTADMEIQHKISDMESFIEASRTGSAGLKDEFVRSKTAEQVLPCALARGYDSLARLLIGQATVVTARDIRGMTPLDHAVRQGQEELVRLLINKGADVNSSDPWGFTPLHAAAERGFGDIACILLENGADVTVTTRYGATPLNLALIHEQHQIATLLAPPETRPPTPVVPEFRPSSNQGYGFLPEMPPSGVFLSRTAVCEGANAPVDRSLPVRLECLRAATVAYERDRALSDITPAKSRSAPPENVRKHFSNAWTSV